MMDISLTTLEKNSSFCGQNYDRINSSTCINNSKVENDKEECSRPSSISIKTKSRYNTNIYNGSRGQTISVNSKLPQIRKIAKI